MSNARLCRLSKELKKRKEDFRIFPFFPCWDSCGGAFFESGGGGGGKRWGGGGWGGGF